MTNVERDDHPNGPPGKTVRLVTDYKHGLIGLQLSEPASELTFTIEQARQLAQELRVLANRMEANRTPLRRR